MMPGAPPPPHQPYPQQAPGGYGQPYGQQLPYGYGPANAEQVEKARKAQKLVSLSRWLLLGGCLTMFGGCGGGIALQLGPLAIVGSILGVLVIVVAAVVGTTGRAMQGRVI